MTNYERLCEAVGIKPQLYETPGREYDADGNLSSWYAEKIYPDFTTEKQNELIKLIAKMPNGYKMEINYGGETLEEALAGLTLKLVETGEIDKNEVRRILRKSGIDRKRGGRCRTGLSLDFGIKPEK